MKKTGRLVAVCVILAMTLAGCSQDLSNDYVSIKQYEGLEVAQVEPEEITDEDVESYIDNVLASSQEEVEVTDRAAETGDIVDINYVGSIDGEEFDGGSYEGYQLELGSGSFIGANGDYPGFEDQIVGHAPGEEFDITVQFPSDYQNEDLADQVANFHITLNGIYYVEGQELNDEWVQNVSEDSTTVEEYKEEVRQLLEDNAQATAESELQSEVYVAFLDQVEVKSLPEDEVQEQYDTLINYYTAYAQAYEMELEDFLNTYMYLTQEEFEEQAQESAEEVIKGKLACDLLAEKKNLTPTDEEYEEGIAEFAANAGYADVDAYLEVEDEETLKEAILQNKVLDYLVEKCVQVEQTDDTEE